MIEKELLKHPFPGNIRELRNMIERAIIISENKLLLWSDFLPSKTDHRPTDLKTNENELIWDLELAEKRLIIKALEQSQNNKSRASDLLNISWQSLDRRMKKFELS
jgi:transcriptional regulator with PAS, ATPase and Fis domain